MPKRRIALLTLLVSGVIVWFVTDYGAWHPRSLVSTPAMMIWFIWIVGVPILLCVVRGEWGLRILLFCLWLAQVVAISIGVYRMLTN